jgi:hypothetical protein
MISNQHRNIGSFIHASTVETVQLLLTLGFTINMTDERGFSLLIMASIKGYTNIVRYLLENGVNVNQTIKDGRSSLHFASQNNNMDIINLLLENGAKI